AFPGLIDGNPSQLAKQAIAVAATVAYAVVATYAIVKVVGFVLGLRVPSHEEEVGLDVAVHGEVAYQRCALPAAWGSGGRAPPASVRLDAGPRRPVARLDVR